jgi:hypothetical protein
MANEWPTKDETISTVADIIRKTIFATGSDDTDGDPALCRSAAIAVINHLAGVYDEAMKNEPPDAD